MKIIGRRSADTAKRKLKLWQKWLIGIIIVLVITAGALAAYVYFYLKSLSLDDIALRHTDSIESSETEESPAPPKVPAIIKKPIEKASDLIGGQEIESQDAVDMAAILLNSGLSLKEISYLQGNASYDLSNEEKQKIRDILLAKLSEKEIEMIRNITKKYGKGLNIVNPDYPIEFVGETDPEQIKKNEAIWAKMQADKQTESGTGNVSKEPNNNTSAIDKNQTSDAEDTSGSATNLTEKQKEIKKSIDSKYSAQMDDLAATCKAQSDSLVKQIVSEIKSSGEVSVKNIQEQFLAKVVTAETKCDSKFQEILNEAKSDYKEAGISEKQLPSWNAQYEKAKADARSGALNVIAESININ